MPRPTHLVLRRPRAVQHPIQKFPWAHSKTVNNSQPHPSRNDFVTFVAIRRREWQLIRRGTPSSLVSIQPLLSACTFAEVLQVAGTGRGSKDKLEDLRPTRL